jgi:hypothetical protein
MVSAKLPQARLQHILEQIAMYLTKNWRVFYPR